MLTEIGIVLFDLLGVRANTTLTNATYDASESANVKSPAVAVADIPRD